MTTSPTFWTHERDAELTTLNAHGLPDVEIAKRMNRSLASVRNRLDVLREIDGRGANELTSVEWHETAVRAASRRFVADAARIYAGARL